MKNHSRRDFVKLMMAAGAMLQIPNALLASSKLGKSHMAAKDKEISIPTGFGAIDEYTTLLVPGALTVIAGRPSMGKTSFLVSLTRQMTFQDNKKIAYFSLELAKENVLKRLLAYNSDVATIRICDDSTLQPSEIRKRLSTIKEKNGLDVVIIDYFNLLKSSVQTNSRAKDLEALTSDIKRIAVDLNLPVIVAAQLDRSTDHQKNKRPKIGTSSSTAALEKFSDIFCSIYREAYYDETLSNNTLELSFLKNRFGKTGTLVLGWEQRLGKVFNPVKALI